MASELFWNVLSICWALTYIVTQKDTPSPPCSFFSAPTGRSSLPCSGSHTSCRAIMLTRIPPNPPWLWLRHSLPSHVNSLFTPLRLQYLNQKPIFIPTLISCMDASLSCLGLRSPSEGTPNHPLKVQHLSPNPPSRRLPSSFWSGSNACSRQASYMDTLLLHPPLTPGCLTSPILPWWRHLPC